MAPRVLSQDRIKKPSCDAVFITPMILPSSYLFHMLSCRLDYMFWSGTWSNPLKEHESQTFIMTLCYPYFKLFLTIKLLSRFLSFPFSFSFFLFFSDCIPFILKLCLCCLWYNVLVITNTLHLHSPVMALMVKVLSPSKALWQVNITISFQEAMEDHPLLQ